jgi:hypothetical protein
MVHHEISGERITRQPEPRRVGIRARNIGILLQPCRIDRALIAHRLCPQVSGKKFPQLVSRQFARLRLRGFEFCNAFANTTLYHQLRGLHVSVLSGSPGLPISLGRAFAGCHGLSE